jgi:hypothetical protein
MSWFSAAFDGDDHSVEMHHVLGAIGTLSYVGTMVYHAIAHGQFDPQSAGIGLGAVWTGTGAVAWGQGKARQAQGPQPPAA